MSADENVPVVDHPMTQATGWTSTRHARYYDLIVVTAPDGKQYVQARDGERATLIRTFDNGLPPYRLVNLDTSRALRGAARGAAEVEMGAELVEVKKERGRKIRAARVQHKEVVE